MTSAVSARKLRHVTVTAVSLRSLVLALFLLLGVLAGYAASGLFAPDGEQLRAYFHACVSRITESSFCAETAVRTLLCYFRGSVAAFLLGFSAIGVVCLPLLLAAQGFVLSFSLFSFAEAMGQSGFLLLFVLFTIRLLFVLPCTFMLGVAAMERLWSLASLMDGKRIRAVPLGLYRFAACCVCLLLGCALELWLVPIILRAAT